MKQLKSLLDKLEQANTEESSSSLNSNSDAPEINYVFSLLAALIKEGQQHQQQDWASHMTPSADEVVLLGKLVAAMHNGNLLSPSLYPLLHQAEQQTLAWLCKQLKFNHGHFTAGGTYSNLDALLQARNKYQDKHVVYGSEACHYSIAKACHILGLRYQQIEVDNFDKIDLSALSHACKKEPPAAIVMNLGTTARGEIDDVEHCIKIAKQYNAWAHIDAAWGGAILLLERFQQMHQQVSHADSISFDPHKALGQAKASGVLLYQSPLPTFDIQTDYLESSPRYHLAGSYGGELFLPLWLSLQLSGHKHLLSEIESRIEQAAKFHQLLNESGIFTSYLSETGIVCFAPIKSPHTLNQTLIDDGVFSSIQLDGVNAYRAVFASSSSKAKQLFSRLMACH
jgi:glutamate/tyrosine decarboxylase-like PLP-dependent enzyme